MYDVIDIDALEPVYILDWRSNALVGQRDPSEPSPGEIVIPDTHPLESIEHAVPLPPAVLLFGSALLGLLGWQVRKAIVPTVAVRSGS